MDAQYLLQPLKFSNLNQLPTVDATNSRLAFILGKAYRAGSSEDGEFFQQKPEVFLFCGFKARQGKLFLPSLGGFVSSHLKSCAQVKLGIFFSASFRLQIKLPPDSFCPQRENRTW